MWLQNQNTIDKIVFVENSGYPLDELKKLAKQANKFKKKIEFLSFKHNPANDVNISMGELKIIDHALKNSELLNTSKYFAKVTGRIFIPNIDRLVSNLPEHFHAVCSLSENLTYVDSVIGVFDKEFYSLSMNKQSMLHMRNAKDKRTDFERVWARTVLAGIAQDHRWFPFYVQPILQGMSGTKNTPYRNNRIRALKMTIASRPYHYYFRNAYGKYTKHKHLFERWNIKPIK